MAHVHLRLPALAGEGAARSTPLATWASRLAKLLAPFGALRAGQGDALAAYAGVALTPAAQQAILEAASVRRCADRYARTDRGYADDLYAAADRHERLAGVDGPAPR